MPSWDLDLWFLFMLNTPIRYNTRYSQTWIHVSTVAKLGHDLDYPLHDESYVQCTIYYVFFRLVDLVVLANRLWTSLWKTRLHSSEKLLIHHPSKNTCSNNQLTQLRSVLRSINNRWSIGLLIMATTKHLINTASVNSHLLGGSSQFFSSNPGDRLRPRYQTPCPI